MSLAVRLMNPLEEWRLVGLEMFKSQYNRHIPDPYCEMECAFTDRELRVTIIGVEIVYRTTRKKYKILRWH